MKEWIAAHKVYLGAGVLLIAACLYYVFIYQPQNFPNQLTGIEQSTKPKVTEKNTGQEGGETTQIEQTKQMTQQEKEGTVMVDVKGEIKQPGVYQSKQTERVIDVIQRAGGFTEKADQSQVNLAAHVEDAMVIYIPAKGEEAASSPAVGFGASVTTGTAGKNAEKININKANETELQNLQGIGPAKASAIIQYREENGPFKTIEDLKNISGIGDKTFEKLKESISVQ